MLIVFVAPYFTENARLFLGKLGQVDGIRLALVSQEPVSMLSPELKNRVAFDYRVDDALDFGQILTATRHIVAQAGPVHRLLGAVEQLQVPLAEVRRELAIAGMTPEVARGFRDKTEMKRRLAEAGVPVARFAEVTTAAGARAFAAEVGYPLVVKPPAGAASQTTFRVTTDAELAHALAETGRAADGVVLLEEFMTGREHSFDAFVADGRIVSYSISNYHPTPLEVMQNAWMQWVVVLPRENDAAPIADAAALTLATLGLETGMCHLEWFEREGGGIVSEVAARPPGAQFVTLIGRAHGVDAARTWADLVTRGDVAPLPPRRFATAGAYLRGQGEGRVVRVHGFDVIQRDLGELITDVRLPTMGQQKSQSYEGEGFILLRHPESRVVEEAAKHVVSTMRVELAS